jgi:HD-GYP domain-containing protein (c-di-GMP phosphodiesterase class II)
MIDLAPLNQFLRALRQAPDPGWLEPAVLPVLAGWHPSLAGHSARVARYAARLAPVALAVPLHPEMAFQAALLHDLGKLLLSPAVALPAAGPSPAERARVRVHPVAGHRLLRAAALQPAILAAVLHHHESWDGQGYPLRLRGFAIPRIARLIAVADAFDRLTASPPLGEGLAPEAAAGRLTRLAGSQLDPDIVDRGLPALARAGVLTPEDARCLSW